jgi:lipoprotein-anchoring transpeptidase ErfK/SrfK
LRASPDTDDSEACWIEIDLARQHLVLYGAATPIADYPVSAAKRGAGEQAGSECTPRGEHVIAEKIGDGAPLNTVFVGRRPTGERYSPALREAQPDRDFILTRILWLAGTEPGRNLGGEVDTQSRYIYIHGAADEIELGRPGSRGCVRMRNRDVVDLFDRVRVGTRVLIR